MQQDEEHNESEDTNIFNTRLCFSRGTSSLELRQHLRQEAGCSYRPRSFCMTSAGKNTDWMVAGGEAE